MNEGKTRRQNRAAGHELSAMRQTAGVNQGKTRRQPRKAGHEPSAKLNNSPAKPGMNEGKTRRQNRTAGVNEGKTRRQNRTASVNEGKTRQQPRKAGHEPGVKCPASLAKPGVNLSATTEPHGGHEPRQNASTAPQSRA